MSWWNYFLVVSVSTCVLVCVLHRIHRLLCSYVSTHDSCNFILVFNVGYASFACWAVSKVIRIKVYPRFY